MNKTLNGSESGLLAYYNFDDTDGDLLDVTGSGYDGTLNGGTAWVMSGAPIH